MDIIVCLKQNVDMTQVRIKKEAREPVLDGLPFVFGDMDRNALEEAVRMKEKIGGKVIAVSVGSTKLRETIKDALAAGADEAVILIDPLFTDLNSQMTAKILAKAIQKIGKYDLIILGEGSADNYSGQVGPRLAEILALPAITYVGRLEYADNKIQATRNMEESLELIESSFPLLITVTSGINEPRLPSLMQILKASKKPLQEWNASAISITSEDFGEDGYQIISNLAPVGERKGVILEGQLDENIDKLVNALQKEGVLGV
ncbi:MAG: electron transfer flavoprotein subunit beta/FixA family protein [Dehalococcoidia bacterium]|jgi:electron transfer flavoprotein beta subunit